jgi:hypothetical protein
MLRMASRAEPRVTGIPMAPFSDPLACGDLIAHRRYVYGKAAAEDGDWAAAAEMFGTRATKAEIPLKRIL